jgi:hypothetical protein
MVITPWAVARLIRQVVSAVRGKSSGGRRREREDEHDWAEKQS